MSADFQGDMIRQTSVATGDAYCLYPKFPAVLFSGLLSFQPHSLWQATVLELYEEPLQVFPAALGSAETSWAAWSAQQVAYSTDAY
jgi:hypothetical protein